MPVASSQEYPPKLQPIGWPTALAALAVCFVRGGNQVALKFGLTAFSPSSTAFWRMLIGLLTVGIWAWARGLPLRLKAGEWRPLLQLALLFVTQIGLLHAGADLTSPAYAVVLMNSNPVFANLIAHFVVPEDRLSGWRTLGLGSAFAGVAAVLLGRPNMALAPNPVLGNAIILCSAILVALRTVYTQRLVQRIEPTRTVFWQMLLSVPCFGLAALLTTSGAREAVSRAAVVGLLYQGVVISGAAFIAWVMLLRKHSPGKLTVFSFTVPIFGVLFSALFFAEPVTPRLILGVLGVGVGVSLATRGARGAAALAASQESEA